MSLLLLIETATTTCSVALAADGLVLACKEINQRNVHAEVITVYINELFELTGKSIKNLDAIAVSSGPGSYTGLRIGVSTAKGLCFALDKPLIAIETLEAMADGFANQEDLTAEMKNTWLFPMLDARRMEVYTAGFDGIGNRIRPTSAEIIDEQSFSDVLAQQSICFFGDGADKCQEVLSHQPNALFYPNFVNSARHLSKTAEKKYLEKDFEDVAYFEPFYLKDFIAGKKKDPAN